MSNTITIENVRIENLYLSVGGTQTFSGQPHRPAFGTEGFRSITPGKPTIDQPIWVIPNPGRICAFVDVPEGYSEVWAVVSPTLPTGAPMLDGAAVAGTTSNSLRWRWTDANLIPGAVSSASGLRNYLLVWHRPCGAANFVYGGSVAFFGYPGNAGIPCGGVGSPSGSGSTSGSILGGMASKVGRPLATTLRAVLSGNGTMSLAWDGSTYWQGAMPLTCGITLRLRFTTGCVLEYSCDGMHWTIATPPADAPKSGQKLSAAPYTSIDLAAASGSRVAGCGIITATIAE